MYKYWPIGLEFWKGTPGWLSMVDAYEYWYNAERARNKIAGAGHLIVWQLIVSWLEINTLTHQIFWVHIVLQVWFHYQTNLVGQCQMFWYGIKTDLLLKKLLWISQLCAFWGCGYLLQCVRIAAWLWCYLSWYNNSSSLTVEKATCILTHTFTYANTYRLQFYPVPVCQWWVYPHLCTMWWDQDMLWWKWWKELQ